MTPLPLAAWIEGIGFLAPGLAGWPAACAVLRRQIIGTRQVLVQKGFELAFGHCAHEAIGGAAIDEGNNGGNGLNAKLACNSGMLVNIHFDQLDLATSRVDQVINPSLFG